MTASGLGAWVQDVITQMGYAGILFLIALENIVPPIPSEVVLPLAGFVASRGPLTLPGVVLAATAGSVLGALVLYAAGHALGEDRVRGLTRRYGRFALVREEHLDRSIAWFRRNDAAAVTLGRLAPAVRSLVSIPAGVAGMPLRRFLPYTALGSGVWNLLLAGAGFALGEHWERVGGFIEQAEAALLVLGAVAAAVWLLRRRSRG